MKLCDSCSADTRSDKRFCSTCDKRTVFYCSHCGDNIGKSEITDGKCMKCYDSNKLGWVEEGK
jgi:predicted amidophosphoribosyltransferase